MWVCSEERSPWQGIQGLVWLQLCPGSAQLKASTSVQWKGDRQEGRVWGPSQPLICCVTLTKSLSLSGPQFCHLSNGGSKSCDNL